MKFTGLHPSGGDESEDFHSDHINHRLLEHALEARGVQMRDRAGLAERVLRSNPLIRRGLDHASVGSIDSWKDRWGMGLAIAASLAAAVFVMNVIDVRRAIPNQQVVATADSGGTMSEPVLVSLLAGSEVVTDSGDQEFVVDEWSAMPILRLRDASFGDLNAEVQLILASAGTT
ncbi:MAG: hypothetical protein EXS17_01560 [Phycisphaerales bacterium]|nr:hypothetical protein [Phycisphaerales bacterium]